jgi:hypothetical protein
MWTIRAAVHSRGAWVLRPAEKSRVKPVVFALLALVVGGGAAAGWFAYDYYRQPRPEFSYAGPEDGRLFSADDAGEVRVEATTDIAGALDLATLTVDGEDVTDQTTRTGTTLAWEPGEVADGTHEVRLQVPGEFPIAAQDESWSFSVDQTVPELTLDDSDTVSVAGEPVSVTGQVSDDAEITAGEAVVEPADDGAFTITFDEPPTAPVEIVAADAAGNAVSGEVAFETVPSRVIVDKMRGVHVTAYAWKSEQLREGVLDLARAGKINTVQLDLKDESGLVGFQTDNALAAEIGADLGVYDLDEAVAALHDLGVEIVGRIVVFRDGELAEYAWDNGMRDDVVQTAGGQLYTGNYEGFGNIASPEVWDYNIDLAEEAAAAGVDSILWDYVRKPDGDMSNFIFPGLELGDDPERAAQDAVLEFIRTADERLAPYEIQHGASVYGVAADRPHEIAQDISGMAPYVDYVAPMVYPSHWGPGEFGVADPNAQPGLIVQRSLEGFLSEVEGTDAEVVPWLQDFPWPVKYTPAMVRDQIDMAAEIGVDQWLMWNAGVFYQDQAYDVITDADTIEDHAGSASS